MPADSTPPTPPMDTAAHTAGAEGARGVFQIVDGEVHILFAFDIGQAIDLDRAESLLTPIAPPGTLAREAIGEPAVQRTPEYFEFHPAPVRVGRVAPSDTIAGRSLAPTVECVLYDFGAVSLSYRLPMKGALSDLVTLADELYENQLLLADARRQIETLAQQIGPAVFRSSHTPGRLVEDYVVYHMRQVEHEGALADAIDAHADTLARILRAERGRLSTQETREALASRMSYSTSDAVIIDWNAAVVIQEPAEDILTVLEFANVELLEVRYLDDKLDGMLDRAYESSLRNRHIGRRADMKRIASLQMDAALLFEAINNALKLMGDQYLARVYRLAAARFHLPDWDASIQRKVGTLESVYRKIADDQAARRMEVLEWIVIILIAVSIVLPFVISGMGH